MADEYVDESTLRKEEAPDNNAYPVPPGATHGDSRPIEVENERRGIALVVLYFVVFGTWALVWVVGESALDMQAWPGLVFLGATVLATAALAWWLVTTVHRARREDRPRFALRF